ncbi:MAG: hypothetical protein AB7O04_00680 [Hyphomonadaceae bacterium]
MMSQASTQAELQPLLTSIAELPHEGRGPALMAISARGGEGAARFIRALAFALWEKGRAATVAIDLDVMRNGLKQAFEADNTLGEAREAQFHGQSYLQLTAKHGAALPAAQHPITFRRVGFSRILVADFDAAWAAPGARVEISQAPDYWRAARAHAAFTLCAAPPASLSRGGLHAAPHMDGVILVVSATDAKAEETLSLKRKLDAAGARVLGLAFVEADPAITRVERALGRIGQAA